MQDQSDGLRLPDEDLYVIINTMKRALDLDERAFSRVRQKPHAMSSWKREVLQQRFSEVDRVRTKVIKLVQRRRGRRSRGGVNAPSIR